jgi:DNA-binding PucR family transcriptional regulator
MPAVRGVKQVARALRAVESASRFEARLAAVRQLAERVAELEAWAVHEAREAGLTWTQIGAVYGMTKQAAQQRFRSASRSARRP